MKILIAFGGFLFLSACSTPQTKEEFKNFAPKTALLSHQEFTIENADAPTVKTRLNEFANRCLTAQTKMTCTTRSGLPCGHASNLYTPTVTEEADHHILYLQWLRESGSMSLNKVPDGGDFILMVDLAPKDTKQWAGSVHVYRGMGDLSTNAINWVSGGKKLCPTLQ